MLSDGKFQKISITMDLRPFQLDLKSVHYLFNTYSHSYQYFFTQLLNLGLPDVNSFLAASQCQSRINI